MSIGNGIALLARLVGLVLVCSACGLAAAQSPSSSDDAALPNPLPPLPATGRRASQLDAGSAGGGGPSQISAATVAPTTAQAEEARQAGSDTNNLARFLKIQDSPVQIYGWLQNSYTGNANGRPRNGLNFGVFPNRSADSWQGNQYYFIVENALEQKDYVNLGFRFDTLFGNDWQFVKSYGLFDRAFENNHFGGLDFPQIYGEVHLPVLTKNGLDIRGGRFYSPAGFENVQAIKRPLLSVPYLFNFTPFTLFGASATLHVNERVNLYGGTFNGWDRWIDKNYKWSGIGGVTATSRDGKWNYAGFVLVGPDQLPRFAPANSPFLPTGVVTTPALQGKFDPYYAGSYRVYNDHVLTRNWSDRFTEAFETFFVHEQNVYGLGPRGGVNKESAWYGFAHWYLYQFNSKVQGVWRAEVFRDQNGAATGVADTFYEQTIGAVYKPKPWLWIRPEARYDWAQFTKPFNDGTRGSQLTLAFDVIVQF